MIRSDGVVVTNLYVVEGALTIKVTLPPPDGRSFQARMIGGDSYQDLGSTVRVQVVRQNGETATLMVTLGVRPLPRRQRFARQAPGECHPRGVACG